MKKSEIYSYHNNLLMSDPMGEVKVNFKNPILRIMCKHTFLELVRWDRKEMFLNPNGDEVEIICPKCGASRGVMFWEHEGWGYK